MKQKINDAIAHGISCLFMGLLSAGFFAFCLSGYGIGLIAAIGGFIGGVHSYHKFAKEEKESTARRLAEFHRQTVVVAKRTRSRSQSLHL